MDIGAVMALAPKHGDPVVVQALGEGQAEISKMLAKLPKLTVTTALLEMNSPSADRFTQGLDNLMMRINEEPNSYKGVDLVAGWHHRNLRIFANVAKTIQPGDQRVLVLIGAGHAPILRQLVRDAPDMKVVEGAKVLKP